MTGCIVEYVNSICMSSESNIPCQLSLLVVHLPLANELSRRYLNALISLGSRRACLYSGAWNWIVIYPYSQLGAATVIGSPRAQMSTEIEDGSVYGTQAAGGTTKRGVALTP